MKTDKEYDYLIVGSGLFGATFAHEAMKRGQKCLVIDKRNHVGGNVYCENVEGINVHKYGAHIFHTSDKSIWDYVNAIVPFNRYTNSPVVLAPDDRMYNLPFNMNTFYQMWGVKTPVEAQIKLDEQRRAEIDHLSGREPENLEEQALILVGRDIYELLIKEYTEKQWGRKCSELPAFIIRRLPVRMIFDNNYFNDLYQGIPIGGYNRLIEGLLKGVDIKLNTDFFKHREELSALARKTVYTGPIDQFYAYRFGQLQYRTVRFDTEILDIPNYQGNAVVNYISKEYPFTRIIEHKHFEMFGSVIYDNSHTVISREFSIEWSGGLEPYYSINDERNAAFYKQYHNLAVQEPNTIFGGRLAEYRYYDMAPIIAQALSLFSKK